MPKNRIGTDEGRREDDLKAGCPKSHSGSEANSDAASPDLRAFPVHPAQGLPHRVAERVRTA